MKADILRRAEAMSDDEDEEDNTADGGRAHGVDVAFEDELDDESGVRVRDGQSSEDEGDRETEANDEVRSCSPSAIHFRNLFFC